MILSVYAYKCKKKMHLKPIGNKMHLKPIGNKEDKSPIKVIIYILNVKITFI